MPKSTEEYQLEAIGFVKTEPPAKPDKPEPPPAQLTLAQAIYGHLRVNDGKQPFTYVGNPVTIRGPKGKAFG